MRRELTQAQRIAGAAGLVAILFLIFAGANDFGDRLPGIGPLASHDLFWWPILFVTPFYVAAVERRPLSSIGLIHPTWATLIYGVAAALIVHCVAFPLSDWIELRLHLTGSAAAADIYNTPYWYRFLLVTRAAFAEEVIYRGYLIERTEDATASPILAAILSLGAFCYGHVAFWGWVSLIRIGSAAAVFIALYMWRRDLGANIVAHWVTNAVILLAY